MCSVFKKEKSGSILSKSDLITGLYKCVMAQKNNISEELMMLTRYFSTMNKVKFFFFLPKEST